MPLDGSFVLVGTSFSRLLSWFLPCPVSSYPSVSWPLSQTQNNFNFETRKEILPLVLVLNLHDEPCPERDCCSFDLLATCGCRHGCSSGASDAGPPPTAGPRPDASPEAGTVGPQPVAY